MLNIFGRTSEISESSETLCSNRYIADRNHTRSLRDSKRWICKTSILQKLFDIVNRTSNIPGSSEINRAQIDMRDPNHTMSIRDLTTWIWENTYPFWTCHPSGNLVDGLPLAIHKDDVLASCRFSGRAPIRKFRCKILDDAYTYRKIMRGNPGDSFELHINASKLAI